MRKTVVGPRGTPLGHSSVKICTIKMKIIYLINYFGKVQYIKTYTPLSLKSFRGQIGPLRCDVMLCTNSQSIPASSYMPTYMYAHHSIDSFKFVYTEKFKKIFAKDLLKFRTLYNK